MTSTYEVEGDLLADLSEDDSSSDSDVEDSPMRRPLDDSDEEIEVFHEHNQGSFSPKNRKQKEVPPIPAKFEDEKPQKPIHDDIADLDGISISEETDTFGVRYVKNNNFNISINEVNKSILESIAQLTVQQAPPTNDEDDEFGISEESEQDSQAKDAVAEALRKAALLKEEEEKPIDFSEYIIEDNSTNILTGNISVQVGEEPMVIDKETKKQTFSINNSKQALQEIIDIYGSGMGDQEVLLLDTDIDVSQISGQGKKGAPSQNLQPISKKLDVIAEDEDEESEAGTPKQKSPAFEIKTGLFKEHDPSIMKKLEDEWNEVESTPVIESTTTTSNKAILVNYTQSFEYCQSLDLSSFESLITVREEEQTSSGILGIFKSPKKLDFPNSEIMLKFPFLLAQVDYNPYEEQHILLLRTIYSHLMRLKNNFLLNAMDERWENIGFQGRDPRTDVNRSMKLLALLQMLAFIENNPTLALQMFDLSQSANPSATGKGMNDTSWPFMCVSIMFSKEALQNLRSGVLYDYCNKFKNVMRAMNDFHQGCFAEFGRLLLKEPTKHHALHLTSLRQTSSKQPLKILKEYSSNYSLPVSAIKKSNLLPIEALSNLDSLDDSVTEKAMTSNVKVSSRASKFSVA